MNGAVDPLFPLGRYINHWGLESSMTQLPNGDPEGYLKNLQYGITYKYKVEEHLPLSACI